LALFFVSALKPNSAPRSTLGETTTLTWNKLRLNFSKIY